MAASRFTGPNRAEIVARIEAGASVADAARAIGAAPDTVKKWIARGRKGEPEYAEFVAAVEAARMRHADQPPMTRAEFQRHLDAAVRAGSVQAMKLWSELDRERSRPGRPAGASKITDITERRRRAQEGS